MLYYIKFRPSFQVFPSSSSKIRLQSQRGGKFCWKRKKPRKVGYWLVNRNAILFMILIIPINQGQSRLIGNIFDFTRSLRQSRQAHLADVCFSCDTIARQATINHQLNNSFHFFIFGSWVDINCIVHRTSIPHIFFLYRLYPCTSVFIPYKFAVCISLQKLCFK